MNDSAKPEWWKVRFKREWEYTTRRLKEIYGSNKKKEK